MVRINLLSREDRQKKVHATVPQAAIVAVVILAAGGMWGYWYFVKGDVERLREDVVATRSEIARNQEIVRVVEQYTRDKKLLLDRLAVIQRLAAAKNSPVRLLDGISRALPDDGWLTGISKVSGRLVIQGYATSHFAVAELMLALQRLTPIIQSVELNFSEFELYEGRPVERFEVLAVLSG